MPPRRKKRAARKPKEAAPPPVVAAPPADRDDTPPSPGPKPRGMTTEQIRRVGDRIAEHERDLKNSTSRR